MKLGSHHNAESRALISIAGTKRCGARAPWYGKHHNEQTKEKISKAFKGRKLTTLHKCNISSGVRRNWKGHTDESKAKIRVAMLKRLESGQINSKYRDTKPELAMKSWLEARGVEFQQQVVIAGALRDFVIPSQRLIIEVDGCYWHGCQEHHPGENAAKVALDKKNDIAANKQGWKVIRIWEHSLQKGMRT